MNDYAKRIKGIYNLNERLAKEISKIMTKDEVPIVLAGGHSSALGTISGIRMAYPQKRLGVIWIDAHADLHSPYTTPSGNMHGMPLACVLGEDNKDRQQNKPDERHILPEELEGFEQCWLTGTAAEVTPVGSIGDYTFEAGALTQAIAGDYEKLVRGKLVAA